MTASVRQLLDWFDALTDGEKQEAMVEVLRRTPPREAALPDDSLVEAAEALFLDLDGREAADAHP